jgi:hypothetical protein
MDRDDLNAIAALAFCSADSPDWAAFYRKVCRWFSSKFAVPLPEVEDSLSEEYVLKHYFEDMYLQLAESTSDDAHKQWTETKGRIAALYRDRADGEEDLDEDSYWEKALEEEFRRDNPGLTQENRDSIATKSGQTEGIATGSGQNLENQTQSGQESGQGVPIVQDDDGWTHAPNLEPEEVHVKADDPIPED